MAIPELPLGSMDEQAFRNAIGFAMQMGRPNDPAKAAKFVKKSSTVTYWKGGVQLSETPRTGRNREPLDPEIKVVPADDQIIEVDCAVEVFKVTDLTELPVGKFKPLRAEVTVLDDAYELLEGVKEMSYNGDRYLKDHEPEVNGLFGVDVHTIVFYALDES